ncbi:amino acid ABC transporter permease [Methylopila sp. Yamaguchi]|uniref:amino acid ABC transporter permease n=1 Tax=Methylopila sp. Yamaguchi TaxID=1437817 RepID=UPI000CB510BE|nr:amino acid ABC transporter permease [Methylopila sp. Yamaguchi]GBD47329.1 general L-amino acid transport system permease AapM [Methylopila sp. Yamaguchi]
MSDVAFGNDQPFVRKEILQPEPPPASLVGISGWARQNLFAGPANTLLSVVCLALAIYVAWIMLDFLVLRAVWTGANREACIAPGVGACWPFITARFGQLLYGFYPAEEHWRPATVFFVAVALIAPLLTPAAPYKKANALLFFVAFPIFAVIMLSGGVFGLRPVETRAWGGLLVTLVVATTGIVASLPLGVLLALGRRSKLPVVRFFAIAFIEFWRGVPLITVLFFATYMLPLFLPSGWTIDGLLRALVGVSLFSAAYMAEVVRGGLQAIPKGQYEGAMAMGLRYWPMMILIVLPQALKLVIPGIVNTFIGLFKDTTLVAIVSIFDFLGIIRAAFADPNWATPGTVYTGFAFAGIVYFIFCYGMSRYSRFVEERLDVGHKH